MERPEFTWVCADDGTVQNLTGEQRAFLKSRKKALYFMSLDNLRIILTSNAVESYFPVSGNFTPISRKPHTIKKLFFCKVRELF